MWAGVVVNLLARDIVSVAFTWWRERKYKQLLLALSEPWGCSSPVVCDVFARYLWEPEVCIGRFLFFMRGGRDHIAASYGPSIVRNRIQHCYRIRESSNCSTARGDRCL